MPDHRVPPDVRFEDYLFYLDEAKRVWGKGLDNIKPTGPASIARSSPSRKLRMLPGRLFREVHVTATSRELVYQTLDFAGPARAPRDLWTLPIAETAHPAELASILAAYPARHRRHRRL